MQQITSDTLAAKRWGILLKRLGLAETATVNEVIETITVTTLAQLKGEVDAWMAQAKQQAVEA